MVGRVVAQRLTPAITSALETLQFLAVGAQGRAPGSAHELDSVAVGQLHLLHDPLSNQLAIVAVDMSKEPLAWLSFDQI